MKSDKELEKLLERAMLRVTMVNTVIALVLAVPAFWAMHFFKEWCFPIILLYLMLIIAGILYSPNIANKIWKD